MRNKDEFYGTSVADWLILNREAYRGRGRPRKTDYMTVREASRKIIKYHNDYIDKMLEV